MSYKKTRTGLGLGDSRDSLMTGAGSRYMTKIFSQSEFYQWQRAEVIGIDLNPPAPEFVGRIKFRTFDEKGKDESSLSYALPLISYLRTYPVLHEMVAVTEFDGKYYWLSPLNSLGLINNNTQANLTAKNTNSSDNSSVDYKDSQAYGIPKSSTESGITYGDTFKNNKFAVGTLSPNEGDVIIEGRFSNSIRLGNNPESNLPNIKISVRDLLESYAIDKENLDEDSCIFITTDEVLTFNPVGIPISEINNPPAQYDGKQILLTSDRIVFNAKLNEILMFSNKSISFGSNENFSIDTNNKIVTNSAKNTEINTQQNLITNAKQTSVIKSPKIYLGDDTAKEALVLGHTLVKLLEQLLEELSKEVHPTPAGPSGPPTNSAAYLEIKNKLITALSKRNFTL